MSASEHDSRLLDNERHRNDDLLAENARLRIKIARLNDKACKLARDIRDLLEE